MRTIARRLAALELAFAPQLEEKDPWGSMGRFRDELIGQVEERGDPSELEVELEALGPLGFWREVVRGYLKNHGFVQDPTESFAGTVSRALGINADELRVCIAGNRIGSALLDRFREPENTADITT